MLANDYLGRMFPSLLLSPGLFYRWEIGIRFELGINYTPDLAYVNSPYLQGVYKRAITLFEELHSPNDSIFIVIDIYDDGHGYRNRKFLRRFIKEKSLLYQLRHETLPDVYSEESEEDSSKIFRFTLRCRPSDLKYTSMLKAICNQDMGIKPSLSHTVYFMNLSRNTIFHVYDDRGCDVLGASPDSLKGVYERFSDWILEYDRDEIDKVFIKGGQ
ncbi:DUF3885 domain-containing protein [Mesobacillus foraminis]|uniref:Uncharacterized protein DUF3885 n=1 Tax=Mesobacillus foraminis TaxID=279826 RepID=A0A4R2BI72_9BACI|nr:DUF3885 domain-containing protein [Mesobacillus foraminis]TCN26275.1 uncharacterized protein DUF3885 [Mesobacillus foraminis]